MIMVFVYGTLRKGEVNHRFLESAVCIAEQSWTFGELYDSNYGYPAIKQASSTRVYGELYSITEKQLVELDELEGYSESGKNNLYERIIQTIHTDQGTHEAYVYIANKSNLLKREIPNGDWKEYILLSRQKDSVLYFAYGSCMDRERFKEAEVDHYFKKILGLGVLPNYSLRFTQKSSLDGMGRADIAEEGGIVEGKVYEIPVKVLKEYLYGREGAPNAYRPTFVTVDVNGKNVQALTFVVVKKQAETAPPDVYAEEILRGANGFLSADYISKLKSHINSLK